MKNDINSAYISINGLLNDICTFLNEEVKNGKLSSQSKTTANNLIKRSRTQLEEIAKIIPEPHDPIGYLSMNKTLQEYVHPDAKPENNNDELYSDIDAHLDEIPMEKEVVIDNSVCPFLSTPSACIRSDKAGYVDRKEKILFFDLQKKSYMSIVTNWLLFYNNEKDNKPFDSVNLRFYEAKEIPNKECAFELSSLKKCKNHYITAENKDEKMEWMTTINKISLSLNKPHQITKMQMQHQSLPVTMLMNNRNISKMLPDNNVANDADADLYEELPESKTTDKNTRNEFVNDSNMCKPELPPRIISAAPPQIQPPPNNSPGLEDYDLVGPVDEGIYDVIVQNQAMQQPQPVLPPQPVLTPQHETITIKMQEPDNIYNNELADEDNMGNEMQSDEEEFYDLIKRNSTQEDEYTNAFAPNLNPNLFDKNGKEANKSRMNFNSWSKR